MAATFERPSVTAELARAMIEAAEQKAAEMGHPFVIAIVDDSGVLKAFSRMDGAPLLSVQVAQDKAYSAVGFGMATNAWHDFVKDDPPLAMGAAPSFSYAAPNARRTDRFSDAFAKRFSTSISSASCSA